MFACAAVAAGAAALFVLAWRLGTTQWSVDELIYRDAAHAYLAGDLTPNREHPPLGKYLIGVGQLVFGESAAASRMAAVLASVATGVMLAIFAWRLAGRYAALTAFAVWTILPHPTAALNVERRALLDVFMVLGVTTALYHGWTWANTGRLRPALVAGVAVGLATAAKLPGALDLPIIVTLALHSGRSRRTILQAVAAVGAAAAAFIAVYLPYGRGIPGAIEYMIRFQRQNSARGHSVLVEGVTVAHPPWWYGPAQIYHDTPLVFLASVAALVVAPLVLDRRLALYLLSAVLIPFGFIAFVFGVQLRHYPFDYLAPVALVLALVLAALIRRGSPIDLAAAATLAVPLVLLASTTILRTASLGIGDYERAARLIDARARSGSRVVVTLSERRVLAAYLDDPARVVRRVVRTAGAIVTSGSERLRTGDPRLRSFDPTRVGALTVWLRRR